MDDVQPKFGQSLEGGALFLGEGGVIENGTSANSRWARRKSKLGSDETTPVSSGQGDAPAAVRLKQAHTFTAREHLDTVRCRKAGYPEVFTQRWALHVPERKDTS